MDNPTLVGMPLFTGRDGKAVELSLGIGELDAVASFEIAASYLG